MTVERMDITAERKKHNNRNEAKYKDPSHRSISSRIIHPTNVTHDVLSTHRTISLILVAARFFGGLM